MPRAERWLFGSAEIDPGVALAASLEQITSYRERELALESRAAGIVQSDGSSSRTAVTGRVVSRA